MANPVAYSGESSQANTRTFKADTILVDVNKVTYLAFNPTKNLILYRDEPIKIGMEHKGSKKKITTFVTINFDADGMKEKGLSIFGPEKLAPFDRIVLDAINTLFVEGRNRYITLNMIYHVITGSDEKVITPRYAREINNSITKMMFTHIVIKADEEYIMYKGLKDFFYDSAILPAERVTATLNGNEIACIHIESMPPLYVYANKKNQIARIDVNLMKLPFENDKRETLNYMTLVFYILRRIIALPRASNTILYETLYRDLGYENESKKYKLDVRKRIRKILTSWINASFGKIKITGFDEEKKSGLPYKVVIHYEMLRKPHALTVNEVSEVADATEDETEDTE